MSNYVVVDMDTGEVLDTAMEDKSKDRWEKTYLSTLTIFLSLADSKSLSILIWLLNNKSLDNRVAGTLSEIAEYCGTTKATVSIIFTKLYKVGLLKKIRNGYYIVNPHVMSSGSPATILNITKDWLNTK